MTERHAKRKRRSSSVSMIGEQRSNLPLSNYHQPETETRVEDESRNVEGVGANNGYFC